MKADKDYGLTVGGEVVLQTDPESAYVLFGKGAYISDADAKKYGLPREFDGESVDATEAKAVSAPPENKALAPVRNKGARRRGE